MYPVAPRWLILFVKRTLLSLLSPIQRPEQRRESPPAVLSRSEALSAPLLTATLFVAATLLATTLLAAALFAAASLLATTLLTAALFAIASLLIGFLS
jgi:hypothetical protein